MKNNIQLSDHFTYRRLLRFTLSPVIMMVFTSIYGVVDGLFISNFVGKTPFAAVNLIMPFVMIIGGMGFMMGAGGTALVSKVMGEGDGHKANRYFTMTVMFTCIMAVILSVLGIIFMPQVSRLLGATDAMMDDCVIYGRIVVAFTLTFMLQSLFHTFLITAERPKLGLCFTVAAGCTNMVLDALFVGVFKWGVVGAAVATGISQCVGGLCPLVYFLSKKNSSRLRLVPTRIEAKPMIKACTNGSSELMSNISSSVVGMLYNLQLMKYAGEDGVSAYGVLMYVLFIFVAVFIGYSISVAPIIGYNYGAENREELRNILKKSLILNFSVGAIMVVLCYALAYPLSKIFVGYDAALLELTVHAFEIYSLHFILTGFNIFASGFFTALNNGAISAAISFLRTLVFQSAAVLVLPLLLDVDGIWWAVCVAEVAAFLISLLFMLKERKRYGY